MHPDFIKVAYDKFCERKEKRRQLVYEYMHDVMSSAGYKIGQYELYPLSLLDVGDPDNGNAHSWASSVTEGMMELAFHTVLAHTSVIYGFADRIHDSCLFSVSITCGSFSSPPIFMQPEINWYGECVMEKFTPILQQNFDLTLQFRANMPYNAIPIPLGYKAVVKY